MCTSLFCCSLLIRPAVCCLTLFSLECFRVCCVTDCRTGTVGRNLMPSSPSAVYREACGQVPAVCQCLCHASPIAAINYNCRSNRWYGSSSGGGSSSGKNNNHDNDDKDKTKKSKDTRSVAVSVSVCWFARWFLPRIFTVRVLPTQQPITKQARWNHC